MLNPPDHNRIDPSLCLACNDQPPKELPEVRPFGRKKLFCSMVCAAIYAFCCAAEVHVFHRTKAPKLGME